VLGKALSTKNYFHVNMMMAMIIVGAFSEVVFSSIFPCNDDRKSWEWYAILQVGSNFSSYVMFTWLYIW